MKLKRTMGFILSLVMAISGANITLAKQTNQPISLNMSANDTVVSAVAIQIDDIENYAVSEDTIITQTINVDGGYIEIYFDLSTGTVEDVYGHGNKIKEIKIPEKIDGYEVKTIADYAFNHENNTYVESINIPYTVTNISENAFSKCDLLKYIGVDSGNSYYQSIDGILYDKKITTLLKYPPKKENTSFVVPRSVTKIAHMAFSECEALTDVHLPTDLTFIGSNAFYGCNNLLSISIPETVDEIETYAFGFCTNLKEIELPKNMERIGAGAFFRCESLENIILPENLTNIEEVTFQGCYGFKTINIPNSVTLIGKQAFGYCNIEYITIPDNVKEIGQFAFTFCRNLKTVVVPKNIEYIYNDAFNGCNKESLVLYVMPNSYALNYAMANGFNYQIIGSETTTETTTVAPIEKGFSLSKHYPQNKTVNIGTGGDTKIYFVVNNNGKPLKNEKIIFTLTKDDVTNEHTTTTDENGIAFVKVNDNDKEQDVKIKLKFDETQEHGNCELDYTIVPEKLSYTTKYEGSLSKEVSIDAGLTAGVGPAEFDAGKLGVTAGNSKSLDISYIQNKEPDKNSTDLNINLTYNPMKASANANIGLNAEINKGKESFNFVDGNVGVGIINGYSITLKDYFNKNNPDYEKNMIYAALSLLDGALMNSTGIMSYPLTLLNELLVDKVLDDELGENISSTIGYAIDYSLGNGGKLEFGKGNNAVEVSIGGAETSGVLSYTNELKGDKSYSKETKSTSEVSGGTFGIGIKGNIKKGISENSLSSSLAKVTSVDYEAERSLKADYDTNQKLNKLSYEIEYPTEDHKVNLLFAELTKNNSLEYEVEGELLDKLKNDNSDINNFVTQALDTTVKSNTMNQFSEILSNYDEYSKYTDKVSEEKQVSVPLSFDLGGGLKLGLDIDISGKEQESYKAADGVYNKNGFLETSVYDDYSWADDYNPISFLKPVTNVIKKFTSSIVDKFSSAVDKVVSVVDDAVGGVVSLTKKVKNGLKMALGIVRNPKKKSASYRVMSYNGDNSIKLINDNTLTTEIEISKIISDTYIVSVTDENDEYVYDFSDSPMTLTIPYNDEMVKEAGGIENMAIYKWDGDAGLYEKYNSTVNETEKNISAEIYYSGEYMICADNTKPSINNFIYVAEDKALKADIKSKLVTIDENSITLLIDGVDISETLTNAYESQSGKFVYKLDIGNGTHTAVLSVKDTKGSLSDAAMMTFTIGSGTHIEPDTVTTESSSETTTSKPSAGSSSGSGGGRIRKKIITTTETTTSEKTTEVTTEEKVIHNDVRVSIGSNKVTVGNSTYDMDVAPYIQTAASSTMVPLRFVAIAINSGDVANADNSSNIVWDAVAKTATVSNNGHNIVFTAGSGNIIIDGTSIGMPNGAIAEITDGRMFIPFRALGTALGVNVDWDADAKTAIYSVE